MTAITATDVTITQTHRDRNFSPDSLKEASLASLTFGDGSLTYPHGGVPLPDKGKLGGFIREITAGFVEAPSGDGKVYRYDRSNHKIKIFAPAPIRVIDEQHTIASNQITLRYPAAFIMCVAQSNANVKVTDPDATLAANECKPSATLTAGGQCTLTFHSGLSGTVYVTYITQAWADVWDNLVQEEAVTVTTNVGALAYDAIAVLSVRSTGSTSTNSCRFLDKDDTVATTEVAIDFTPGAGNTSITFAAADAVTAAVVTYIKKPSAGFLLENWVEEESMTAATNVCTPAYPILLWGYSGQALENGATTNGLINIGGSVSTDEAYINFWDPYTKITQDAVTTGTAAYVKGRPDEVPNVVLLEIRDDEPIAETTLKMLLIGE